VLRTDASNVGIGAIPLQEFDGVLHLIAYASRQLLLPERRYSAIESVLGRGVSYSGYIYPGVTLKSSVTSPTTSGDRPEEDSECPWDVMGTGFAGLRLHCEGCQWRRKSWCGLLKSYMQGVTHPKAALKESLSSQDRGSCHPDVSRSMFGSFPLSHARGPRTGEEKGRKEYGERKVFLE
jgi:hypothetical protein